MGGVERVMRGVVGQVMERVMRGAGRSGTAVFSHGGGGGDRRSFRTFIFSRSRSKHKADLILKAVKLLLRLPKNGKPPCETEA